MLLNLTILKVSYIKLHFCFFLHSLNLKCELEHFFNRLLIPKIIYFSKTFRSSIILQHQKEMNEIEDIMFAMEQQFEESEADARQEFHSLRDEIKNKV